MEPNYPLLVLVIVYRSYSDAKVDSKVKRVFDAYDFQGESGLLQFWECSSLADSDDIGCTLTLTDQVCVSNIYDNRLEDYRRRCFNNNNNRFVGRVTKVGNWFAGRAAQTGVADHRTSHVMLNQDRQYVDEASGMGQLVVPVYFDYPGVGLKLAGIIELVTSQPKESYVADFEKIQNLMMMVNLKSTYMGKTIKVQCDDIIKFTLPFSAKLQELRKQVTMRFKKLENTTFCFKYEDTNRISHSISNDQDLDCCIAESISNRTTVIRMHVEQVLG